MKKNLCLIMFLCLFIFIGDLSADTPNQDKVASPKHVVVELYTTSWCPHCTKAKNFLTKNGIDFVNFDIEKDTAAARRKKMIDSREGVPLAIIDGQTIYGFSERLYRTALDLD